MRKSRRVAVILVLFLFGAMMIQPCFAESGEDDQWIKPQGYGFIGVDILRGNLFSCVYEVPEYKDTQTGLIHDGGDVKLILIQNEYFSGLVHGDNFSDWVYNLTRDSFAFKVGSGGEWNFTVPFSDHFVFVRINPHETHEIHVILDWAVKKGSYMSDVEILLIGSIVVIVSFAIFTCVCISRRYR